MLRNTGNYHCTLLKDFEVHRMLGKGGFGLVLETTNRLDGGRSATKLMAYDDLATREVQSLVVLSYHINVVQYKTCWRDEFSSLDLETLRKLTSDNELLRSFNGLHTLDLLCIQMELCGGDLRQWLNQASNTTKDIVIPLFLQMADGVDHIHSHGLIHRDIKPENIFFGFGTESGVIKIGDLGLSKKHSTMGSASHTQAAGTPLYLAPEQDSPRYGKSVDIYALGIILMEMMCPTLQPSGNGGSWQRLLDAVILLKFDKKTPEKLAYEHADVAKLVLQMTALSAASRPVLSHLKSQLIPKASEAPVSSKSRLLVDFEIISILGTGGFGMVMECKNKLDNARYAVKAVNKEASALREVRNFVELPYHPNVVQYRNCWRDTLSQTELTWLKSLDKQKRLVDFFREQNVDTSWTFLGIQMDLCGPDLREFMSSGGYLDVKHALTFMWQITCGLDHIHRHGIIHRDLKPDNIFTCSKDGKIVLRIGDLGLGTEVQSSHTAGAGTKWYLAPEQSGRSYGPKVDTYALGIIFMELLTPELQRSVTQLVDAINCLKYDKALPEKEQQRNAATSPICSTVSPGQPTTGPIHGSPFNFEDVKEPKYRALVKQLKDLGRFSNPAVEACLLKVDRGKYVDGDAYVDRPQSIGSNVNISAPHMHVVMLEHIAEKLKFGGAALDIGSSSGFITVCMAILVGHAGKVVGIEHITELAELSVRNIKRDKGVLLEQGIIKIVVGDGRRGYIKGAPYDVIHIGAACDGFPEEVFDQLKEGGRLVAPIEENGSQSLQLVDKVRGKPMMRKVCGVRFALLTTQRNQLGPRKVEDEVAAHLAALLNKK